MLAVQGVEHSLAWLYAVANTDPHKVSQASVERQWRNATERLWGSFQRGSPGAKLHDPHVGVKAHIDEGLAAELDSFINRRNDLAHRFLVERLRGTPDGAERFVPGTILALAEMTAAGSSLSQRLFDRAEEIRAAWPTTTEPPSEVREQLEVVGRMVMRKELPAMRPEPDAEV